MDRATVTMECQADPKALEYWLTRYLKRTWPESIPPLELKAHQSEGRRPINLGHVAVWAIANKRTMLEIEVRPIGYYPDADLVMIKPTGLVTVSIRLALELREYVAQLVKDLQGDFSTIRQPGARLRATGKQHKPTDKTEIRADVFKRLKDEHPEWTKAKVAMEAAAELNDPNVNEYTVDYVYKVMGWKWKRGRRTR